LIFFVNPFTVHINSLVEAGLFAAVKEIGGLDMEHSQWNQCLRQALLKAPGSWIGCVGQFGAGITAVGRKEPAPTGPNGSFILAPAAALNIA
jgi:hypothetical protein